MRSGEGSGIGNASHVGHGGKVELAIPLSLLSLLEALLQISSRAGETRRLARHENQPDIQLTAAGSILRFERCEVLLQNEGDSAS